jgi:PAS domain S-box-containing protein
MPVEFLTGKRVEPWRVVTDPTRQWGPAIGVAVAVGIGFFLTARLGLFLLTEPDGVAVFWPASGVAAGVLIAIGPRAKWPVAIGVAAATIIANLLGERTFAAAATFALCNAGEALLAAGLIERLFGSGVTLDRLSQVLGLLAAAVFATAISGTVGTVAFKLFHFSTVPSLTIWQHWVASGAIGIGAFAPLLIGIGAAVRKPPSPSETMEAALALLAVTLLTALAAYLPRGTWLSVVSIVLLVPPLLWLAARCQPVFSATAGVIIALSIVWTTTFGIGHYGDLSLPIVDRIATAQAGILRASLVTLVLAALFAERRQQQARLEEALAAGAVMAFEWDARTGFSHHSANAAKVLGYNQQAPLTTARFLALVHPEDRRHFEAQVQGVRPDKPSYTVEFRVLRPNTQEMWFEETATAEFDSAGKCLRIKGLTVNITERKRADEHKRLLIAELDHRVKNVLARVSVVAMYTREGSGTIDEYVRALDQRIQSMAVAHASLSQASWQGVRVADTVRNQLAPYATKVNTTTCGPDIKLTATATEALAMVLHELVTNASKYGALSVPEGQVSVSWEIRNSGDAAAVLAIVWRERGGPPVLTPPQSGYGTSLIRDLIPHELAGTVDLAFLSEGVSCTIEIPLKTSMGGVA